MKKIAIYILLLMTIKTGSAQSSLSFYHLGDATFQNSNLNPAFIPTDKLMIGLPVLSGVHLNFNNKLNYSQIITKTPEGTQEIDINKALKGLQAKNMLSVHTSISLFHVAFATKAKGAISIFANERVETDFLYSEPFMRLIARGNGVALDEEISLSDTRFAASYFREIGVGYAMKNDALNLKMGARLKYIQGFANASTPENMKASITTDDETYVIDANLDNGVLRSSGLNIIDGSTGNLGSHLISNNNRGVALDLGFTWGKDKYTTISGSITDLGYISWKDDIENRQVNDTSFVYGGLNLKEVVELEKDIEDSLINKFDIDKNFDPYTTLIGPRAYFSYAYQIRPGGEVVTSVGARYVQTQMKMLYGVGYRQKFGRWFTGTVNVTRLPQQLLNLGAALAVKGGPVQFYLAVDQIGHWDMTKFEAVDVRVGFNFVFNGKTKNINDKNSGSTPYFEKLVNKGGKSKGIPKGQSFLGSKKEVKGVDGIYNIIRKQRRRSLEEINDIPDGNTNVPHDNPNSRKKKDN